MPDMTVQQRTESWRRLEAARAQRDKEMRQWNKENRLHNAVGALSPAAREKADGILSRYKGAVESEKTRAMDPKAQAAARRSAELNKARDRREALKRLKAQQEAAK